MTIGRFSLPQLTRDVVSLRADCVRILRKPRTPQCSATVLGRCTWVELLDPSTHAPRSAVERHHLFPKAYLTRIGIERAVQRNQIANYAFVEWPDNAKIGDSSPGEYFSPLFEELTPPQRKQARFWHALPEGWEQMDYWDFLQRRRVLIADVIRAAFDKLRTGELLEDEEPLPPSPGLLRWTVEDLLAEMETEQGRVQVVCVLQP